MRRVFNKNLSKASRGVSQVSNFGHASYIPCKVRFDFSNVRIEKLRTRAANVVLAPSICRSQPNSKSFDLGMYPSLTACI
mmetsp:Transcript_22811/g.91358  ORF Transcript_22811/g.91358 Transcript_22811/m.91358 type:complete len:80 (-) Transcript_22811:727-966(-)